MEVRLRKWRFVLGSGVVSSLSREELLQNVSESLSEPVFDYTWQNITDTIAGKRKEEKFSVEWEDNDKDANVEYRLDYGYGKSLENKNPHISHFTGSINQTQTFSYSNQTKTFYFDFKDIHKIKLNKGDMSDDSLWSFYFQILKSKNKKFIAKSPKKSIFLYYPPTDDISINTINLFPMIYKQNRPKIIITEIQSTINLLCINKVTASKKPGKPDEGIQSDDLYWSIMMTDSKKAFDRMDSSYSSSKNPWNGNLLICDKADKLVAVRLRFGIATADPSNLLIFRPGNQIGLFAVGSGLESEIGSPRWISGYDGRKNKENYRLRIIIKK